MSGTDVVERAKALPGGLPANYEAAKKQLATLAKIDECKDWADKAEALASYARQADDETLMNYAMRVKARAIQRAGELLKEYDDRGRPQENTVGDHGISQREASSRLHDHHLRARPR